MTAQTGVFSVLSAGERLPDFALLTAVIAEAGGLNRDDAARSARHSWGFVAENLEESAADLTLEICERRGLKAVKIRAGSPPVRPPRLLLKKAALTAEGLEYCAENGTSGKTAAADLAVIAAAPVKEITVKTVTRKEGPSAGEKAVRLGIMAVTGLPLGLGRSKEVSRETSSADLAFSLDMLTRGGSLRLGVNSSDFDFSCLGAKKTLSSQVNFRLLCAELTGLAPGAMRNAGLLAMLEGRPLGTLPYDSPADLEKELARLAAISRDRA